MIPEISEGEIDTCILTAQMGAKMNKKKIPGKEILRGILLLLLCLVVCFPFFIMISTSLKSYTEIKSPVFHLLPEKIRLENYVELFKSGRWGRYFWNSFSITAISTAVAVLINSMAGYAFARLQFKGRDVLFGAALLGMIVPAQVTMLPAYVIMKYIPFAGGNNFFGMGGSGLLNTTQGLILIYLSGAFGVFLFRQFMLNFPDSLDDAARIDGLSRFGTYVRIYMPLSKPAIATMVVLRATATWNDYIWPLLMTQKDKFYTVQLALSRFRNEAGNEWQYTMAATAVIILPIIILFLFLQKYFIEGIATTGLKD